MQVLSRPEDRKRGYSVLASRSWDSEIIGLVAQIHEYKGRA